MNAVISLATPADASEMLAIYAPLVRETAVSLEVEPPSEAEFRQRIQDTLAERPWLVCEINGEVAGYTYAGAHRKRGAYRWSVESSVYVDSRHRRKGIATALYTSLFALLEAQDYHNVYAGTALPNEASVALHKAVGFTLVGTYHAVGYKLGAWHDVAWWELSLQERREEKPAPPRPIREVTGSRAYKRAIQEGIARLGG